MSERKSVAAEPPLISDPRRLAEAEASNAVAQYDWALEEAQRWIDAGKPNLRISMLLELHRKALQGIDRYAGNFRPDSVRIEGSSHDPIPGAEVPSQVEELFEHLKDNWERKTATYLSAYAMWRLNWIHPFADGNGRTSRMLSYMILCARSGFIFPGVKSIPEQISENKTPYYRALEAADHAWLQDQKVDVSKMTQLMEDYLSNQLVTMAETATGKTFNGHESGQQKRGIERHAVLVALIVGLLVTAATIAAALI